MSEPSRRHIAFGDPDALREHIAESLDRVSRLALIGIEHADMRIDGALEHAVICATAALRQAEDVLNDLKRLTAKRREAV